VRKHFFIAAIALIALTGCSSEKTAGATGSGPDPSSLGPSPALITQISKSFFQEYLNCSQAPDTTDCVRANSNASSDLEKNVGLSGIEDADPILCAQNVPPRFTVSRARAINDTKAQSVITADWGSGSTTSLMLYLTYQPDGRLLVSNVICG
jgi:hypothetical protein